MEFLATEAGGGAILLAATLGALAWANSPWADSYGDVWGRRLTVGLGDWTLTHDLRHWVNEGLMTLFFFVVGLEIKREIVSGELASMRNALLPVVAAVGGMVAPAVIYVSLNAGEPGARGWGIPMATDIAFAVGALSLFGSTAASARVFLLSLAIVDDIGAIILIAVFYSAGLSWAALGIAAGILAAMGALRRLGFGGLPAYGLLSVALWIAASKSGVHPTIAGVAVGFLAPAGPAAGSDPPRPALAQRLLHGLHPWTSYAIVPLFALANAGVELSRTSVADALTSRVAIGIVVGLVVGKLAGITGASWVAVRLGLRAPPEYGWTTTAGVAATAGIGFTVSLFIADLAFADAGLVADAKIGILIGSVVAAVLGAITLRRARRAEPMSVSEDA
jgi:NhaA family Na+:H+ antiporter